jgi:hypothetical protein
VGLSEAKRIEFFLNATKNTPLICLQKKRRRRNNTILFYNATQNKIKQAVHQINSNNYQASTC